MGLYREYFKLGLSEDNGKEKLKLQFIEFRAYSPP